MSWLVLLPARSTSSGLASPSPFISSGKPLSISASRCRNICLRSSPVITGPGAPDALETTTRRVKAYGSVFGRPLAVCVLGPPPFSLPVKPAGSSLGNIASSEATLTDASRPLNDDACAVLPSQ